MLNFKNFELANYMYASICSAKLPTCFACLGKDKKSLYTHNWLFQVTLRTWPQVLGSNLGGNIFHFSIMKVGSGLQVAAQHWVLLRCFFQLHEGDTNLAQSSFEKVGPTTPPFQLFCQCRGSVTPNWREHQLVPKGFRHHPMLSQYC